MNVGAEETVWFTKRSSAFKGREIQFPVVIEANNIVIPFLVPKTHIIIIIIIIIIILIIIVIIITNIILMVRILISIFSSVKIKTKHH